MVNNNYENIDSIQRPDQIENLDENESGNENESRNESGNENANRKGNQNESENENKNETVVFDVRNTYVNEVTYVNEIFNQDATNKSLVAAANESVLIEEQIEDAIETTQEILDRLENSDANESDIQNFEQTIVAHSTPMRRSERVSKPPSFYYNAQN